MADPVSFAIATVVQIGISYLFPSEGPRLKDLKISASTYGAAIPWTFGLTRVAGNMIWSLPIRERKKKSSAGKGGAVNQYTYFCTFAMGLCKGPVKTIRRVWADGKLIFDVGVTSLTGSPSSDALATFFGNPISSNKYRMRFYPGDEEQVPDSAIAADKGENATAFRGLAYILFDDLPLADFGNRIPQITAEVLVGGSEQTVVVSPLTESNGTDDLETYVVGEAAFDFQRSVGYLRKDTTLRQFNLRTGRVVQDFTSTDMGLATGQTLQHLIAGGHDGAIYIAHGASGLNSSIDRLDPFSLQTIATHATVPTPGTAATAVTNTTVEYLLTIASDGNASLFKALDMSLHWNVLLGGTATVGPFRACGRDGDATGEPAFYILYAQSGGTAMHLQKVEGADVPVLTDVFDFSGTSLVPHGALWDSAAAGVLMFWSDGAQAYLSKWSEDTATEAWRTPIVGCPDIYSGQTTLLTQELGWVFNGRFYVINTVTGEMTDHNVDASTGAILDPNLQQVDWADYLTRYPDVKTEFFVSGFTVAATPEGYAQWHYQNFGQTEGRTLTFIAAGQGTGFALTGDFVGGTSSYQAFDSTRGVLICLGGIDGLVKLNDAVSGVSVGTIVARLLSEGGLPASMTDLTAIYSMPIRGYGWASGTDIKGIFDELRRLYLFDLVERDGILVAVARQDPDNGLPPATEIIKQGALGSTAEDATDFWQETRLQEADLPASISLVYMNIDNDFESSMARSARIGNPIPTMFSRQQVAMEINVVMTAAEAKVQTNKILYSQWLERTKHNTRLSWAYLNLDPGDVIAVDMDDGRTYESRIHTTDLGADFVTDIEAYAADSGAYDGIIGDSDGGGSGIPTSVIQSGLALPFIINTPLLRDQDDQGGSVSVYYAGIGNAVPSAFQGAGLYRSTNNLDYDNMQSSTNDVEWGTVIGTLPTPPMGPFALDWKTRLTIQPSVTWFDLESITDDELWDGANPCIVGGEVIQFRDAVQNADGTWTIWNLLRGRRGTEYACDNHRNGERFVFLNNATITLAGELINARGQARFFKAVATGRSVQESAVQQIAYEPRDLMPYAPADIRREVSTGGDVDVTFARRTRLGGNLMDGTGLVPLAERFERYEAYVLAAPFAGDLSRGVPPVDFLRKYNMTTPAFTYTADEQGIDGFSPSAHTLHVVVFQLSDPVGLGFPGVRSIGPTDIF